jgi:hypothetical protein
LTSDEIGERIGSLVARCERAGRDPASVEIAVSMRDGAVEDLPTLAGWGVDELVVVEGPPEDAESADRWVTGLARRWDVTTA